MSTLHDVLHKIKPDTPLSIDERALFCERPQQISHDIGTALEQNPIAKLLICGKSGSGKSTELNYLSVKLPGFVFLKRNIVGETKDASKLTIDDILLYVTIAVVEKYLGKKNCNVQQLNNSLIEGVFVEETELTLNRSLIDLWKNRTIRIANHNKLFYSLLLLKAEINENIIFALDETDTLPQNTAKSIFIKNADLLTQIPFPVISTIPYPLCYDNQLRTIASKYYTQVIELRTLDVHKKTDRAFLLACLKKQIDNRLITNENIYQDLVLASEGNIRRLLRLLQYAAESAIDNKSEIIRNQDIQIAKSLLQEEQA